MNQALARVKLSKGILGVETSKIDQEELALLGAF